MRYRTLNASRIHAGVRWLSLTQGVKLEHAEAISDKRCVIEISVCVLRFWVEHTLHPTPYALGKTDKKRGSHIKDSIIAFLVRSV